MPFWHRQLVGQYRRVAGASDRPSHNLSNLVPRGRKLSRRTLERNDAARSPPRSHQVHLAAALATWHGRSLRRGPSLDGNQGFPGRVLATAYVIFLVTNSIPRRGLSWLNRMPLEQCIP